MSEIQQNRYDQLLRRVCALYGPGSKVNDALAELFPVIDVERVPSELLLLSGTRVASGFLSLTPDVGEIASIQLFNPADSNAIATVTTIAISRNAAGLVRVGAAEGVLATLIENPRFRDRRLGTSVRPVCEVRGESRLSGVIAQQLYELPFDVTMFLQDPNDMTVLVPGTGVTVSNDDADNTLRVTFLWRERPGESGELQF